MKQEDIPADPKQTTESPAELYQTLDKLTTWFVQNGAHKLAAETAHARDYYAREILELDPDEIQEADAPEEATDDD